MKTPGDKSPNKFDHDQEKSDKTNILGVDVFIQIEKSEWHTNQETHSKSSS